MREYFFKPGSRLAEAISYFYVVRVTGKHEPTVHHLMPDYSLALLFNFGPEIRASFGSIPITAETVSDTALLGPLKKTLNYELLPYSDFIVVNLTTYGFMSLFGTEICVLNPSSLTNLDFLKQNSLYRLLRFQLSLIPHTRSRINYLKKALTSLLSDKKLMSIEFIFEHNLCDGAKASTSKAIAKKIGCCERTVQLRLKKTLGYTRNEQLRYNRFKSLLTYLIADQLEEITWVQTAAQFGYYDQSHMIKDFQQFLGLSPQKFLKIKNVCCLKRVITSIPFD